MGAPEDVLVSATLDAQMLTDPPGITDTSGGLGDALYSHLRWTVGLRLVVA